MRSSPRDRAGSPDVTSGSRFETYVFKGQRGSGVIGINGAAARLSGTIAEQVQPDSTEAATAAAGAAVHGQRAGLGRGRARPSTGAQAAQSDVEGRRAGPFVPPHHAVGRTNGAVGDRALPVT